MDLITTAASVDVAERSASVAILPIGSFEQHGPHLPLITDTVIACTIADAIAETYNLFLLPPVTVSCSHEHAAWPGTVSISATTLSAVISDVVHSLDRSGVRRLALVNGHGGNYVLGNIVQEANVDQPRLTLFPSRTDWDDARAAARLETTGHADMHAGELETSILLHAWPGMVSGDYPSADHDAEDRPHLLVQGMGGYTTSGVIGRPSLAAAEKGKALLDSLVASFASHLTVLGAMQ